MSGTSPGSSVLLLLRVDPLEAMKRYRFVVETDVYKIGSLGGSCTVSCSHINDNIYRLQVTAIGGSDFYYPYITTGDSVGRCYVPVGQEDGTLVLTGGMNGCAAQVKRQTDRNFAFYHDKNSVSIAKLPDALPGTTVCDISFADYAGPSGGVYQMTVTSQLSNKMFVTLYEHYVIAVKDAGKWHMMNSAVLRSQGLDPKNSKTIFMTYDPAGSPRMKSFDDA